MIRHKGFIFNLLLLLAVVSCQKTGMEAARVPLSFIANTDDVYLWEEGTLSEETKAASDPLFNSGFSSFKIWATSVGESKVTIMNGYRVNYDAQNGGWTYTSGEGTTGQSIKSWNPGATVHCFHAGSPATAVTAMTENTVSVSMAATTDLSKCALISSPKAVAASDPEFMKTVTIPFTHAYAKVVLKFVMQHEQASATNITGVKITPTAPTKQYPKSAVMTATYNWDGSPSVQYSLGSVTYTSDNTAMVFGNINLDAPGTTLKAMDCVWYVIPDNGAGNKWSVTANVPEGSKSATIPAGKAQWQPGKVYTYEFTVGNFLMLTGYTVDPWVDETINIEIEG